MKRTLALKALGLTSLALALVSLGVWAGIRDSDPTPPELKYAVAASPSPLSIPGQGEVVIEIGVPTGFHIFSDETLALKLPALQGVTWGKAKVPQGKMEEDRPVLRGTVRVAIPVTLAEGAAALQGNLDVEWQACQEFGDKVCFLPTHDSVPFKLAMQAGGQKPPAAQASPAVPPVAPPPMAPAVTPPKEPGSLEPPAAPRSQPPKAGGLSEGYEAKFARAAKENIPLALLLAFVFGILSSLTPCIYPVIPITVAYIGSRSEGKGRFAGFLLSLAFVGGLAIVYATLGAVSATAGQAFGSLTQTPWVGLPIAALFFVLSLSMFNLFEFKTPSALTNRIEATKRKGKGKGFGGAFLIGALSGLVASPCIGPLILAILVAVAATGSVALGFLYLFVYALGMGVLFIVIGTFSGVLGSLPKSGGWMDAVRIFFGALILAAAFYFAGLYLPRPVFFGVSTVALLGVVAFLLFGARRHFFSVPARVSGIVLCAAALAFVVIAQSPARMVGHWEPNLEAGLAAAKAAGTPALVDMRADWCVACVELEKKTWPDKEVGRWLETVVAVRLDMTKNTDQDKAVQTRYGVKGLPTVLLLGPDGKELGRFTGFKDAKEFLAWAGDSQK